MGSAGVELAAYVGCPLKCGAVLPFCAGYAPRLCRTQQYPGFTSVGRPDSRRDSSTQPVWRDVLQWGGDARRFEADLTLPALPEEVYSKNLLRMTHIASGEAIEVRDGVRVRLQEYNTALPIG